MNGSDSDLKVAEIGILGGSFDPVHSGHLLKALDALEALSLDRVLFVPAYQAPLKGKTPSALAEQRVEMLRIATASHEHFSVWTGELERGGTNYSVDTAEILAREFAGDVLYWIIGTDQLLQLHQWRGIKRLAEIVEFACLDRPGYPFEMDDSLDSSRIHRVRGHAFEVSSTEIRDRVAERRSVDLFLPMPVCEYIVNEGLYRD